MIPKIPYFQTSRYRVAAMVDLAKPKLGELGADLGSGDGRIVIAFAKAGIQMHGYEIDEELIRVSNKNIQKELAFPFCLREGQGENPTMKQSNNQAIIFNKDFWFEDFSKYDIISCYPMPTIMGRLEKKLQTELRIGARVVLNYFPFLHWKEKAKKDNVYLYLR